jgi:ribosomal protection tetracycline resistance protein
LARRTLNLGILAHVDAGKTTLTERLLYAAGVIDSIGSVDAGTTQTDTLVLERERGITIRSSVVSFDIDGVTVNLIDTPGHPDFIAEVERILGLLDGAVLVVSAVEGVQPQTRILMRALRRLRVPTLLFVNKVDRRGADVPRTLDAIRSRLGAEIIPLGTVDGAGTPTARFVPYRFVDPALRTPLTEVLSAHSESLLADYIDDEAAVTDRRLRAELVAQTGRSQAHPVFLGSAITGTGVDALLSGLVELLPAPVGNPGLPAWGRIFKIERAPNGEKAVYVRMHAGTLAVRQRLRIERVGGSLLEEKATAISVAEQGSWVRSHALVAGQIGRVTGLGAVRIGDTIGHPSRTASEPAVQFPPPTMQSEVVPASAADGTVLRESLAWLADQDPLINVRNDETGRRIYLSLYGEVQKEVIQATLANDFGLAVTFRETTPICVERPLHRGEAVETLNTESNPFQATIGLRVEPGRLGSGLEFRMRVAPQAIPMYVYKSADAFTSSMEQYVRQSLREGLSGWQVIDCVVTMYDCWYSLADGPPSRRGPLSTPADFRYLTPMVLMQALDRAGTVVCEPTLRVSLEVPVWAIGGVVTALGRAGAALSDQVMRGDMTTIEAVLPAARVPALQRDLPALTAGEGVLESTFDGYRPVAGDPPTRPRTTADPRRRQEYLLSLNRRP